MKTIKLEFQFDDGQNNTTTNFANSIIEEVNKDRDNQRRAKEYNNNVLKFVKRVLEEWREAIDRELEPMGLKCMKNYYIDHDTMNGESHTAIGYKLAIEEPRAGGIIVTLGATSRRKFNEDIQKNLLTEDLFIYTDCGYKQKVDNLEHFFEINRRQIKKLYELKLKRDNQ